MGFFSAAANAANKASSSSRDKDPYGIPNMYANANPSTRPLRYPDVTNPLTKPSMAYKSSQTPFIPPGFYTHPAYQQPYQQHQQHQQHQQPQHGKQAKPTFASLMPTNKAHALQESRMAKPALKSLGRISEKGRQFKVQKEHDEWADEQGLAVKQSKMGKMVHPQHRGLVPDDQY